MVGISREGIGSTKGDRSRRVEVGPRLLAMLADRRAAQAEHHTGDDGRKLIFPGRSSAHLDRSHVSQGWHRQALTAARLRQTLRLHDLRHSAAASWLASGLPMIFVQRQLGHSDIKTTIEHYGHLEESFLKNAALRAEDAIWATRRKPVLRWYHESDYGSSCKKCSNEKASQ